MEREAVLTEKSTLGCDGVERVRAVEGYRRDGAGCFDGDCAGHGSSSSLYCAGGLTIRS